MAISLEHWTRVCPAAIESSHCCILRGSHLTHSPGSSYRTILIRFRPTSSNGRHDSQRRRTIVMRSEAADGRRSGTDQPEVRKDASNTFQEDSEMTKDDDEADLGNSKRKRSVPQHFVIPCLLMRGGTSRGTFFMKQHLPQEKKALDKVLLRVMGSPHPLQIDGLGGTKSVTSKVAILTASGEPGVDVDYTFAEVLVDRSYVDWEPTCGNMLAAVGPAAIEMGLVSKVGHPETVVRIRATNNGALVETVVQTPNGTVTYDGDAVIDGVPGTAAPITLNFMNVVGSKTGGKLLPTGRVCDRINGVEVTCIDVAMPVVIARASSLGKTGYESPHELDDDVHFFRKVEAIRVVAGRKMGLGDVSGRVIPKFAIVAEPRESTGNITARYLVPFKAHASMAVTGAICIGSCSILRGSVADELSTKSNIARNQNRVVIEHPSGRIVIFLDTEQHRVGTSTNMTVHRAGVMRTARLIFEGSVHVKTDSLESLGSQFQDQPGEKYRQHLHQLQRDFRKLYRFKGLGTGLSTDERWAEGDGDSADLSKSMDELQPSRNAALGA